jgi:hypothetical protein
MSDYLTPEERARSVEEVSAILLASIDRDVVRWEEAAKHWYRQLVGNSAPHLRRPHPNPLAEERYWLERIYPNDAERVERELAKLAAEDAIAAEKYCWGPHWCFLQEALAAHCGISPNQLDRMTWEEIATVLRQAVERRQQSSGGAVSAPVTPHPSLNEIDLSILRALVKRKGRLLTQVQIEPATQPRVTRRTISKRLQPLIIEGLIVQPAGKRGGYAITCKGRDLVEQLLKP